MSKKQDAHEPRLSIAHIWNPAMRSAVTIREATAADELLVSELLNASYPNLMATAYDPFILAATLPFMTRANSVLLRSGTYYLSETQDGAIVGCGGWTFQRPSDGSVAPGLAHIRHFATHPDWIGGGIGRALYARCEDKARSAGAHEFECCSSLNAEGFYSALGFNTVKRIDVPMGRELSFPAVLMRRTL